ncbi:MAG: TonB-dependent receptor plug domain-containing protein, partial [Bergeyella zoohelcum]|nr:TonB-dependent receptor plug domain-containing protein [Bergeyella zoohelcum]
MLNLVNMNVNFKLMSAGALFFLGGSMLFAQKKDTATKTKDIEEVVVVGYQTKSKKELTTSVVKVGAKEMNNVPITSFDQILAGKAAGVDLQIGSGQPGASASVVIRGAGSINGGTTPLYIVDGVPVSAGAFATINPNDIEDVSILKDASAKAIYGSQAGAGVVLVTTKIGRKGAMRIEYTGSTGVSMRPQAKFGMMTTSQITGMQRDLGLISEATYNSRNLINTDWDKVFLRTGFTISNDLSVSGGGGNTTYKISLGHLDQEGIALNSGLQRFTGNINLRSGNGKNFRVGFNGIFGLAKRDMIFSEAGIALANPFAAAYLAKPYESLYKADGSIATGAGLFGANAYELATMSSRRRQEGK